MNVTLQRHCAKHIYVIPEGLRELMSDISREVLRVQPEDMYTYIADYLDALMITRENARVAARFVQEMNECAETIVDFLTRTGLRRSKAEVVAGTIQNAFRNYLDHKGILKEDEHTLVMRILDEAEVSQDEADVAAKVIQDAFRSFKERHDKEKELLSGVIDWRIAARSAIKLYRKTGVSNEEAKKAATLIKAAYKGYYTRRALKRMKDIQDRKDMERYQSISTVSSHESADSDKNKSKSVRIDLNSIIPHVDFETVVTKMEKTSIGLAKSDTSLEYIRRIVMDDILGPICGVEKIVPVEVIEKKIEEKIEKNTEEKTEEKIEEYMDEHEFLLNIAKEFIENLIPDDEGQ